MDFSKLKRDPKKVHSALDVKGDTIKAKRKVSIVIPERYKEKGLIREGNEVVILGIHAYVVDDQYFGISLTNAMMPITPSSSNLIYIGEEQYMVYSFEAGETVCPNRNLVQTATIPYEIFDELVSKGNTPVYLNYLDLAMLFDSAKRKAGADLSTNHAIMEMINASRARNPKDKAKYYRHTLKSQADFKNGPSMIPLRSVQYGATNTVAKLIGAYWDEGLTSALVNPSERSEQIEEILRK
jgi:hypothetical protein